MCPQFLSLHVMVVDDEPIVLKAVSELVEFLGHTVTKAQSGEEALDLLSEKRPDILLSDIRMPHMDGIRLIQEIRERDIHLPIVLMTGYAETYNLEDTFMAGADEYLTKPFKKEELQLMLQRAFWRRQATKRQMRSHD
jgi:CheY-like chemotaxis protein